MTVPRGGNADRIPFTTYKWLIPDVRAAEELRRKGRTLLTIAHTICQAVPHRQLVFTIPKRLRLCFRHDHHLLGELARAAMQTQINVLEEKRAKAQKHSGDYSKPPSSNIVKPRRKTGKMERRRKAKIGGQPGHDRHARTPFSPDVEYPYKKNQAYGQILLSDLRRLFGVIHRRDEYASAETFQLSPFTAASRKVLAVKMAAVGAHESGRSFQLAPSKAVRCSTSCARQSRHTFGQMKRHLCYQTHRRRPSTPGLLAACRSQWYTRLRGAFALWHVAAK